MNTKSKIYISIFIVFIITMVASASYAYITRGRGIGDILNSDVATTAQKPVYSAYSDGELEFNISALQMSQLNVTTDAVAVDNANIYVDLTSSSDNEGTRCTYDVVWVWDSKDKYTTSDVNLPYTDESGKVFPHEFSIKINDGPETDLSKYTWSDTGTTKLLEGEFIESSSATQKTQNKYNIEVKMYNINAAQRNLFKKEFLAHIEIQNYECYTSGVTGIAVADYKDIYDGEEHTVTVTLDEKNKASEIYYSTTTKLDRSNYKTAGTKTKPTRTEYGTTPVYWCAGGGGVCGTNKIQIERKEPIFTIASNSFIASDASRTISYQYDGDGAVTCETSNAADATCTVNQTNKTVTINRTTPFTNITPKTTTITLKAAQGTNYLASSNQTLASTFRTSLSNYIIAYTGTNQGAGKIVNENGYRYEGDNPNNYISFNGENWRIIGVFDSYTHGKSGQNLVKIMKWTNSNVNGFYSIAWNTSGTNNWNNASMKTLLNGDYLNRTGNYSSSGIQNTYRNYIQPVYWKIGGYPSAGLNVNQLYTYERNGAYVPSGATAVTTQELSVGLMYGSDYGYGPLASDCPRTTNLSAYNGTGGCYNLNWLFISSNFHEWTLMPNTSGTSNVFRVENSSGYLADTSANTASYLMWPVVYLKKDVYITGGAGTTGNPYTISI